LIVLIPNKERYFSGPDKYLIVLDRNCSKTDFLRAAQVANGNYASELVERIYDCLISHATDVLREHRGYYVIEYPDLEAFLYWKYNVDCEVAVDLVGSLKPTGFLGYGSVYSGGDGGIGQLIVSEPGLEVVNLILGNLREDIK